jgi:flagellar biosynthesis component FlhA
MLDEYFRRLAKEQSTPNHLRAVLPRTIERLGDYLDTVIDPSAGDDLSRPAKVTPIVLEVSGNLAPEKGKEEEWPLLRRFMPEMRERIEDKTGVRVPGVRIRSNEKDLSDDTYIIMLDEVPVVVGHVSLDRKYSPTEASVLEAAGIQVIELEEAPHPLSKQPGWWIPEKYWDRVQMAEGCTLWPDPMQFVIAHLEAVLVSNLADFLGVQEVWDRLERWRRTDSKRDLTELAVPDALIRERLVRVLRALLREQVPITAWDSILRAFRGSLHNAEIGDVVECVRLAIKTDLPGNSAGAQQVTIPPEIEDAIIPWVTTTDSRRVFAIPPEENKELLAKIRQLLPENDPVAVLVTKAAVRDPLRRLIERELPNTIVQSREETLDQQDRKTVRAQFPAIAEWSEFRSQGVETDHEG